MTGAGAAPPPRGWSARHLAALLVANVALALGPWSVRLADSGPIAAGFWRLALALPLLFGFALAARQPLTGFSRRTWFGIFGGGLAFAVDLASWHLGIGQTRLGNATLFGNSGSLIIMVWGLVVLSRSPSRFEWAALACACTGAAILFGRSFELGPVTFAGGLLCLFAGFCYAFYIILLQGARVSLGSWALLAWSSAIGVPVLLGFALLHGEPVWPHVWWPLLALALGSQIIGQGLLVYALRHFPPLVIGLVLLMQPAVGVLAGWFAFGERLTGWDVLGMVLVGAALAIARAGERS